MVTIFCYIHFVFFSLLVVVSFYTVFHASSHFHDKQTKKKKRKLFFVYWNFIFIFSYSIINFKLMHVLKHLKISLKYMKYQHNQTHTNVQHLLCTYRTYLHTQNCKRKLNEYEYNTYKQNMMCVCVC